MRSADIESPVFHPLMIRLQQPVTRRAVLLGVGALAASASMASAAMRQEATPELDITGDPDAVELLERSATVMAELDSFAFEMNTVRGSSTLMQGFELKSVTGTVRRPMDLQAEVEMSLPIGSLTIGAIALDGTFWIQDPLSDGTWMELGSVGEVQTLINPDLLIQMAVRQVQDAAVIGTGKVDGADATIVEGYVDFSGILENVGDVDPGTDVTSFFAEDPVIVTFWIDTDGHIVEVEMLGPILASESDNVMRVISLYDFNEPVEIEAPEDVATPEI